ncbi:MAG: type II toxin-antitoxin system RelB/DinJ family antitoxin [Actinomycetaceae bacterium]|nr:type II toxin-antitoxin system RelB/DinJ family antitoxin [Actinomycetaceae bacterium]
MAQATFSVRMEQGLKEQFDALCKDFGMNVSTAINVFATAVVRERRIPFDIVASTPNETRQKTMDAFMSLRNYAQENGIADMSLDEINAEIRAARQERKAMK